jgi:hypothetical protein
VRLQQRFPVQSSLEQPLFLCFMFLHRLLEGTPRGSLYSSFLGQAEDPEMKWMASEVRGSNEHGWSSLARGPCHLCSNGPCGLPRLLLVLQKVLVIKY